MEEHVYPNEAALDREDDGGRRARRAICARSAKEHGLWAPHLPPEAGGSSGGFLVYAHLNEEIGRSLWGQLVFGCQAPGRGQRRDPLDVRHATSRRSAGSRPLVAGEIRSFFSMTEPEVSGLRPDDRCGRAPCATATSG